MKRLFDNININVSACDHVHECRDAASTQLVRFADLTEYAGFTEVCLLRMFIE